jgi:hypothetical protein
MTNYKSYLKAKSKRQIDKAREDNARHQAKVRQSAPSIVVDGVSYKIPAYLRDAPDEELIRVIRGWGKP